MLCDNFKHVLNVEESFHFSPKKFGQSGNILILENFQAVWENLYAAQKIQITIVGPPNNNNNKNKKLNGKIWNFFFLSVIVTNFEILKINLQIFKSS